MICQLPQALPPLMALRTRSAPIRRSFRIGEYPYLSTGALEHDIYRWKLPTVFDMAAWITAQGGPVGWEEFDGWYTPFGPSDEL